MLKQNLTKVIAVATIAAGAIFITGCTAEETAEDPAPSTGGEVDPKPEDLPPKPKGTE
jgi:PBP1b-binding outer membrane lipoprotein LpoB